MRKAQALVTCAPMTDGLDHLRVLVAGPRGARLDQVRSTIAALGHEVIASESDLSEMPKVSARVRPEVAFVIVTDDSPGALKLIDQVVHESACPVIAVLDVQDRSFIKDAARRGIFAYLAEGEDSAEMQSSIDIVLRRFAEYQDLEGAFGRRAVTERAKGILMERHGIDEEAAFSMLREQSRRTHQKLVDLAQAVVDSRRLLPARPPSDQDDAERR